MIEIVDMTANEFTDFDLEYNRPEWDYDKESRRILGDGRAVIAGWGHPCLGLKLDGKIVSINSTYFTRRPRKNSFGRYINVYLSYTLVDHRFQGYATMLIEHIEKQALDGGWHRLKSLAGSYGGVRLHFKMGHHFYGVGKKGALIVDSPLRSGDQWPDTVPIEARNATLNPKKMDRIALEEALKQPPFNQTSEQELKELKVALDRYEQRIRV